MTNSIDDIRSRIADAKQGAIDNGNPRPRVVLVPTMGALHAGHLALVDEAAELGDIVVVSIFVNPLQFGPGEDLDSYPRTLEQDVAQLAQRGVSLVFAPTAAEMYPDSNAGVRLTAGDIGASLEGATRPGHFDGMLTVVAKLFHIVGPDVAVFGEKDRQQLFLVKRMAKDLNFGVEVHGVETVRASDGLALSSRNVYLEASDRAAALALSAALAAAANSESAADALDAAHAVLAAEPRIDLDYLALVDPSSFAPVSPEHQGQAIMLVAARVGSTRLIDNRTLSIG